MTGIPVESDLPPMPVGPLPTAEAVWRDLRDRVTELLPSAIYVCDPNGTIIWHSEDAAELWGRSPQPGETEENFFGSLQLYRPNGQPFRYLETPAAQVLKTGRAERDQEITIERSDGSLASVRMNSAPLRDATGRQFGAINWFIDDTERMGLEARLLLAQEAGGVGTFDRDLRSDSLRVSQTYWRLFGVEPNGFPSSVRGWFSRIHRDDRQGVLRDFAKAVESGNYETEYRVTWPDGQVRWLHSRGRVQRSSDGRPLRALGAIVDITDRKQAEEVLRRRESELRRVTDAIPAFIAYVDSNQCYRLVNRAYVERRGRPREEIEGRHMRDVLGDAAYERVLPRVRQALAGEFVRFETRLGFPDGSEREVDTSYVPRFSPSGRVLGFYIFFIDVTERNQVLARLRARTTELAALLETVPAAVWVSYDREGTEIFGNRYAAQLLRAAPEDNLSHAARQGAGGVRWFFYRGGDEISLSETPLRRALRGEVVRGEDLELVFEDRARVPLLMNAAPVMGPDGEPIGAIAAAMDISDRKRIEDRQKLVMAELDHRVRNILAGIRSILLLAGKSAASKEELSRAMGGRVNAMARAHGLLTQTGWRGASLRSLIADELAPYDVAERHRVKIDGPDLLLRSSSVVSMALLVHELTTNATKHGSLSLPEGELSVSWRIAGSTEDRRLKLSWMESGGPPVTEPTRSGFGTVMLERVLAHEFGADIDLDFTPGGLRFAASVPLPRIAEAQSGKAEDGTSVEAHASAHGASDLTGARVLVVEDDALIAFNIVDLLESAGATVVGPVGRLDEAVGAALQCELHVALLDLNLGGHPVYPLADMLAGQGIPFAFLTGYQRDRLPERFREVPVLQKPAGEGAILDTVRRVLESRPLKGMATQGVPPSR